MKILLDAGTDYKRLVYLVDYLRNIFPEVINQLYLFAIKPANDINMWASQQTDFTYIYFEDETTAGNALNQVIQGLEFDDDLLIMNSSFIPLFAAFDRLLEGIGEGNEVFAVGPVSNSFNGVQNAAWQDAEEALDWSEQCKDNNIDESLYLHPGVILFCRKVIQGEKTFDDEAVCLSDAILEKCVREYLNGSKMYISKASGFWDVRGPEYKAGISVKSDILRDKFGIHYLNVGGNETIVNMISDAFDHEKQLRILEIGCDCGGTLFMLKRIFKNAKLFGTDISDNPIRITSKFATVKVDNIEDQKLDFGENNFDIIIFGDVLEHLRDPLSTLIYCKKLLAKNGCIVASIPNLMNMEVMKHLLDGDFPYEDYGLLDRTHIHMFTYNEILKMFVNEAGYKVEKMTMSGELSDEDSALADKLSALGRAEKFMYQAYQYQIIARVN